MAWSTPTATTTSQVVTSGFWNAQVTNNFAALVERIGVDWTAYTPGPHPELTTLQPCHMAATIPAGGGVECATFGSRSV